MKSYSQDDLLALRARHEGWLRNQPGVIGTGVGLDSGGKLCLKVFATQVPPAARDAIRSRLHDVPWSLEEGDDIVPY